jgi:hypothetical protein
MSGWYFAEPVTLTNPGDLIVYGIQFFEAPTDSPPMIAAEGLVLSRSYWESLGWNVSDYHHRVAS